jgi:hypothetical protein
MHRESTVLLNHLETKHRNLDNEIKKLYSKNIDDLSITQLKKQKLKLKEQIEAVKKELNNG